MPRTNLCKDRQGAMKRMLVGYIYQEGLTDQEAAEKLGVCRNTYKKRMAHPYEMTVNQLLDFCRKYHIPIEELRSVIIL